MTTGRYSRFAAVLTLAAGGVLFTAVAAITAIAAISAIAPVPAVAQDAPPAGDGMGNMIERLRQRGIDVTPEQIERAQQVMQDIRDGIPPDPNQLRLVFGDIRKQVEKQRQKQLQEELGATDEEWKALGPKIEKVRTLSRLVGDDGAAGGMPGGGPGGMPGRAMFMRNADPNAQPADIENKAQTLQTLLANKQAKPEAVVASLKAYRDARVKTKQDLAKAQQELKDVLTVRQEAQLVTMGILE
jgi:Spy/CpxP family protein refolding chaperone